MVAYAKAVFPHQEHIRTYLSTTDWCCCWVLLLPPQQQPPWQIIQEWGSPTTSLVSSGTQGSAQRALQQLGAGVIPTHSWAICSWCFEEFVRFLPDELKKTENVQELWEGKWSLSRGRQTRVWRIRAVAAKKHLCMRVGEGEMWGFTCRQCRGGRSEAFFQKGNFLEKMYFEDMGTSHAWSVCKKKGLF